MGCVVGGGTEGGVGLRLSGGESAGEGQVGEGFAGGGFFAFSQMGREVLGVAGVTDGDHDAGGEIVGDGECAAGFVVIETTHGVGDQAHGGGLKGEVFPGGAGVEEVSGVGLIVLGEGAFGDQEEKGGAVGGPKAIGFEEKVKEDGPVGGVAEGVEEAPGLFVACGGGPTGGFDESHELLERDRLAGHAAGRPAAKKKIVDGVGGLAILVDVDVEAGHGVLLSGRRRRRISIRQEVLSGVG